MTQAASHRRRPGHQPGADAGLDDLFGASEAPVTTVAPGPRPAQPWVVRAAIQSFVLSAVIYTAMHIVNLGPPYPLILAVSAGCVLVRKAVRTTAEQNWLRTSDTVKPLSGPNPRAGLEDEWGDGMLDAVRRWDRRLEWGVTDPERFLHTVAGRLGELADERLRQHHGFTRASDSARARALLGEEVWFIVHGPLERVPTPAQLARALNRLEQL